uniref:Uncharacterized protein n=1 Tax=Lutzomyia longipalpis TaxID=7200 RepID=A0A1B0C928_LUTLO
MQSNSETSDFAGVDFAGIRALDPGGLYQVINIRNQEFIDHTFLGHVEIQETSLDVCPPGGVRVPHLGTNLLHQSNVIVDPGKITTYVQNLSVKPNLENGTNVIVDQRKDKQLATLTPIGSSWVGETRSSGKIIQATNPGQYSLVECPDLSPIVMVPGEKSKSIVQDLSEEKGIPETCPAEGGKAKK